MLKDEPFNDEPGRDGAPVPLTSREEHRWSFVTAIVLDEVDLDDARLEEVVLGRIVLRQFQ